MIHRCPFPCWTRKSLPLGHIFPLSRVSFSFQLSANACDVTSCLIVRSAMYMHVLVSNQRA